MPSPARPSATVVYQASDLSQKRRAFIDEARTGRARVRDTDGLALVMLQENELNVLDELARWAGEVARIVALAAMPRSTRSLADYGSLTWLRVFDDEDLATFISELAEVLIAASAEQRVDLLHELLDQWRLTAEQLHDPLRRSVLLSGDDDDAFVEVGPPG